MCDVTNLDVVCLLTELGVVVVFVQHLDGEAGRGAESLPRGSLQQEGEGS